MLIAPEYTTRCQQSILRCGATPAGRSQLGQPHLWLPTRFLWYCYTDAPSAGLSSSPSDLAYESVLPSLFRLRDASPSEIRPTSSYELAGSATYIAVHSIKRTRMEAFGANDFNGRQSFCLDQRNQQWKAKFSDENIFQTACQAILFRVSTLYA